MIKLKECPLCGNEAAQIYTQPSGGQGGVPRHRVACHGCGALSDFRDEFIDGRDRDDTICKVAAIWNRRPRIARSEELADLVGVMRSLLKDILAGTRARTKAAQNAQACAQKMTEEIAKILPLAKKGGDVVALDVTRPKR